MAPSIVMLLGVTLILMNQPALSKPQTAKWSRPSPPVTHDFENPSLDHTAMAMKWENEGEKDLAVRAFESAAKHQRTANTLANLGVCKMRRNDLDAAERIMLEAHSTAFTDGEKEFVENNLDNLAQHLAFRQGEPVEGAKYRRRVVQTNKTPGQGTFQQAPKREVRWQAHDGEVTRPELLHQRANTIGTPFPRKTTADLDVDFRKIRDGPFILTDGMEGWNMLDLWKDEWEAELAELFPEAVTDFYPYNMLSEARQSPYLTRLPKGIKELMVPQAKYHFGKPQDGNNVEGRYMHLQLTPVMWEKMEASDLMPPTRHEFLENDEWFAACMGQSDSKIIEEWHLKTHWKIILTGTRGAGMFNHSDALLTSSWHSQILGRKWWYVCGTHADGRQVCYEDILKPGEILYYPRRWHHETQCVETPTMTLTDTVAHEGNAEGIMMKTYGECTGRNPLNFDFSSQLCDALDKCHTYWKDRVKGDGGKWRGGDREPWRDVAPADRIKKMDETKPGDNNYDGRNYITEMS